MLESWAIGSGSRQINLGNEKSMLSFRLCLYCHSLHELIEQTPMLLRKDSDRQPPFPLSIESICISVAKNQAPGVIINLLQ